MRTAAALPACRALIDAVVRLQLVSQHRTDHRPALDAASQQAAPALLCHPGAPKAQWLSEAARTCTCSLTPASAPNSPQLCRHRMQPELMQASGSCVLDRHAPVCDGALAPRCLSRGGDATPSKQTFQSAKESQVLIWLGLRGLCADVGHAAAMPGHVPFAVEARRVLVLQVLSSVAPLLTASMAKVAIALPHVALHQASGSNPLYGNRLHTGQLDVMQGRIRPAHECCMRRTSTPCEA